MLKKNKAITTFETMEKMKGSLTDAWEITPGLWTGPSVLLVEIFLLLRFLFAYLSVLFEKQGDKWE